MKFVIFSLLFLLFHSNIDALERNKDSEALEEKTREMMDQINKILRDFYNSVKDAHRPYSGEIKRHHDEINMKPYYEQGRVPEWAKDDLDHHRQHSESMRLYYDLQDRYADLQRRLQELQRLKREWTNNQYDRNSYQEYTKKQEEYKRLLALYKQDLEKHHEMKRMLVAR